jgi:hypothetical protein
MIRRILPLLAALAFALPADEGLWLFNQFPQDQVKEKYDYAVTDAFLEHLRLASVTLGAGSGAWVSPHGLIATNQHLVAACVKALRLEGGFYAASFAEERKCPGLEAKVLVQMEDVTRQVKSAAPETAKPADALAKRNAAIARLEQACAARAGNSCSVVRLHSGERYDLYQYRTYGDLRLVFVPEQAIASFGGAPASLTYPRYAFDVAFLRAYADGRPASTPRYLQWSAEGVKDGELVFASGSPVSTSRLATAAQLTFYRDTALPVTVARLETRIAALRGVPGAANETARLAAEYKLAAGKLIGLRDDWLMLRKTNFEKKLRNAVEADPKLGTAGGKVWDEVAAAYKNWAPFEKPYQVLAPESILTNGGAQLDEAAKIALLTVYLQELQTLGEKEAPLKAILAGKTPRQVAEELARIGTARLTAALEEPARKLRKKRAETIEALETSAAERIAQYRYRVYGAADYPDATSTLRLTFGSVKAYRDRTQAPVPYATTFGGLYYLAAGKQEVYQPPQPWIESKSAIDLVMPLNFVSTCDITSGAAGGPVVNTKGEFVGITFDGNLDSIATTYLYSDDLARAVHVASQGVLEALRKVYHASNLLAELGVGADSP